MVCFLSLGKEGYYLWMHIEKVRSCINNYFDLDVICVKLSTFYSPTFMVSTVLVKRKPLVVLSLSDEFEFICSLEDKEGNEA